MRARTVVLLVVWFAVALGCVVAAGELLSVAERPSGATGFDASITAWVVAQRTHALTAIARVLSAIGSQKVLTPVVVVSALVLLVRRHVQLVVLLVVVWGGALALYSLGKLLVDRPRPPEQLRLVRVAGTSFPSGHAVQSLATFAVLALVAGAVWRPAGRVGAASAVLLAVGVAWSRVYLGVHWTTDVVAGLLAGAAWTAAVVWVLRVGPRRLLAGGG